MSQREPPTVEDIIEKLRKGLEDPACTAVGLERAEAQALVSYFDDTANFARSILT